MDEERQSSNEELQSLDEELQTVNLQLQIELDELSHPNDDMTYFQPALRSADPGCAARARHAVAARARGADTSEAMAVGAHDPVPHLEHVIDGVAITFLDVELSYDSVSTRPAPAREHVPLIRSGHDAVPRAARRKRLGSAGASPSSSAAGASWRHCGRRPYKGKTRPTPS
jgi:hypothetical protein